MVFVLPIYLLLKTSFTSLNTNHVMNWFFFFFLGIVNEGVRQREEEQQEEQKEKKNNGENFFFLIIFFFCLESTTLVESFNSLFFQNQQRYQKEYISTHLAKILIKQLAHHRRDTTSYLCSFHIVLIVRRETETSRKKKTSN